MNVNFIFRYSPTESDLGILLYLCFDFQNTLSHKPWEHAEIIMIMACTQYISKKFLLPSNSLISAEQITIS